MVDNLPSMQGAVCPTPLPHGDMIVLGHGSGGKMSHNLITKLFLPAFGNDALNVGDDAGVFELPDGRRMAFSTDSHVVSPLFFPGGDIGRLAVCGTVNDLAAVGATPRFLSIGFILEEGLDMVSLQQIVTSIQQAAQEAGVAIIAGDTKVVQKGFGDGIYIATSGVGLIPAGIDISGKNAKPGDVVIVSGTLGDHGIAILAARGELGLETEINSDTAPLNKLVETILSVTPNIHVLRDPTRGGLATTLNEITRQSDVGIQLDETKIPIHPAVQAACEMLGFDPLYVANEGKMIVITPAEEADRVLRVMKSSPYGTDATIIGQVVQQPAGRVLMKTSIGSNRVVDMLAGEMLPRIC